MCLGRSLLVYCFPTYFSSLWLLMLWGRRQNSLAKTVARFPPIISYRLRSYLSVLKPFWVYFLCDVEQESKSILSHAYISFSFAILFIQDTIWSQCDFFIIVSKVSWSYMLACLCICALHCIYLHACFIIVLNCFNHHHSVIHFNIRIYDAHTLFYLLTIIWLRLESWRRS